MVTNPDDIRLAIMTGQAKYVSGEEEDLHTIKEIRECHQDIIHLMNFYLDMPSETAELVALWIIGTYCHKEFNSYPFLFINAMRGSGKSRLLNFIASLARNGEMTNNITEAVLFRTAQEHTLIIDEIESIIKNNKSALRELLNSAYKKGACVKRMKKIKKEGLEALAVERFELYTPIVMANINGMDEVTADRCIPIILEKSGDLGKIKLMEDFGNPIFNAIKVRLTSIQCSLCSVVSSKRTIQEWNNYTSMKYNNYIHTLTTLSTLSTQTTLSEENKMIFDRINDIGIDGRNLELFFPLIVLSQIMGDDIFEQILKIAKAYTWQKVKFEQEDSPDIAVYKFIASKDHLTLYSPKDLLEQFKVFFATDDSDREWLNVHWFGRALRRLKLIVEAKRHSSGMKVLLDVSKAQLKSKLFDEKLVGEKESQHALQEVANPSS
jgi:hypothetical protein